MNSANLFILFSQLGSPCPFALLFLRFDRQLNIFLCRKMFIGGLNWETTDGTLSLSWILLIAKSLCERILNSLERLQNVLLCEKTRLADLVDSDSLLSETPNVSMPSWSRNIFWTERLWVPVREPCLTPVDWPETGDSSGRTRQNVQDLCRRDWTGCCWGGIQRLFRTVWNSSWCYFNDG